MSFKRPKKDNHIPQVDEPFTSTLTGYSSTVPVKFCTEMQECMLRELKQILPKVALLTSVSSDFAVPDSESEGESKDTAEESEGNTIPELFISFFDHASVNYSKQQLKEAFDKIYKNCHKLWQRIRGDCF